MQNINASNPSTPSTEWRIPIISNLLSYIQIKISNIVKKIFSFFSIDCSSSKIVNSKNNSIKVNNKPIRVNNQPIWIGDNSIIKIKTTLY